MSFSFVAERKYFSSLEEVVRQYPEFEVFLLERKYTQYIVTVYKNGKKDLAGVYWVKYVPNPNYEYEGCLSSTVMSVLCEKDDLEAKEVQVTFVDEDF